MDELVHLFKVFSATFGFFVLDGQEVFYFLHSYNTR